jgi:hypothetical protein
LICIVDTLSGKWQAVQHYAEVVIMGFHYTPENGPVQRKSAKKAVF